MARTSIKVWVSVLATLMLGGMMAACGSSSESESEVLEAFLNEERAALDVYYGQSDPSLWADMYAEKMTYFDVWTAGKLEDAAAKDYLLAFAGQIPPFDYAIEDPRVDLYGDTAVFTFNINLTDPAAGETFAIWNVSEIKHRAGDGWELVHAHLSWAQAPAEEVPPPAGG